jgi:hypothetical protein
MDASDLAVSQKTGEGRESTAVDQESDQRDSQAGPMMSDLPRKRGYRACECFDLVEGSLRRRRELSSYLIPCAVSIRCGICEPLVRLGMQVTQVEMRFGRSFRAQLEGL